MASRRLKARKLITYGLTALIAVLLPLFIFSTPSNAADATWNNTSITYGNHQYTGPINAGDKEIPDIPKGSAYYTYVEKTSTNPPKQKAYVIYFTTGQDPGTQTTATYAAYDLNGRTFSNPSDKQTITIEKGNINLNGSSSANTQASCSIVGIGWIICPVSNFLASGMDWVFSVLSGFIQVQPLKPSNDPNNDLYKAWEIMRGFANSAFIIAFLIIIYSQITGVGISNYNIKRMLPRLFVAAILVNLSYIICTLGVDLSNILGKQIIDLFMNIRNEVFNMDNSWAGDDLNWQNVTSAILGGSAAGLAAAVGIGSLVAATGGSVVGMIFLVLPALLGLFLTTLMVLLILAARQALIIILVIVAPLAFVANLLPNTEKWYEKWQSTFMTMLIFYPAFSFVFGGSQLAGSIIIQNANSMLMVVLGMIVQVAPLVITPFLIRFSGNTLGKVVGVINNPKRGLIDRTRNFSKDRAEFHKYRNISRPLSNRNFISRAGRNMEYRAGQNQRRTEFMKQRFGAYQTRRRYTRPRDQQLEINMKNIAAETKSYDDRFEQAYEEMKTGNSTTMQTMRATELTRTETIRENISTRMGRESIRTVSQTSIQQAVQYEQESRITTSAKTSAQNIQAQQYATAIQNSEQLRIRAGGIDYDNGPNRALAGAIAAIDKSRKEALANIKLIVNDLNLTSDQILSMARGVSDRIQNTSETRAAALEMIFSGKDKGAIATAYENIDLSFSDIDSHEERQMLRVVTGEAMLSGARAPWVGGGTVAKLKQGQAWDGSNLVGAYGTDGVDLAVIKSIQDSAIDPGTLAEMGGSYIGQLTRAITNRAGDLTEAQKARLIEAIQLTVDPNSPLSHKLGDTKPMLENLLDILNR